MQEGGERCREAEHREMGRCSGRIPKVQGKCKDREAERLEGAGRSAGRLKAGAGRRRPSRLAEEPGRMQGRKEL